LRGLETPVAALLAERGKPFKVAMVACMRKHLSVLNTLVSKKEKWTDKMLQNV
jgi:transposase